MSTEPEDIVIELESGTIDPPRLRSAISGEYFDPNGGYVTDAEGNYYTPEEYSIADDKATDGEGNLPE